MPAHSRPNRPSRPTTERNLLLVLSYDGTAYFGWQRQKENPSLQAVVEEAFRKITGETVDVIGSGRTDRGVHALGHAAHVFLKSPIALDKLFRALNAVLPRDIRVVSLKERPRSFHARFAARRRWYRYYLYNADPVSPFWDRYAWHHPRPLRIGRMRRSLSVLKGTHDFTSFCALKDENPSKVRTLYRASLTVQRPMILFDIVADAFLYHMVRVIVGTVIGLEHQGLSAQAMREILRSRSRACAGDTAPAQGLFLMNVRY